MSIRLVTGLPGSGKSLRGVHYIKKGVAEGRPVYVDGIDGLQAFGWEPCNGNDWQNLPDGSLVVIDEAQKRWPTRRSSDPPSYIAALSEHRHRGFDFVLLTQHPAMLDTYVRRLVNGHEHLVRQFGTSVSRIFEFQECFDDPQSTATRARGTESIWRYPKDLFPLYTSATLHTVKAKLPKRLVVIPVLLVIVAVLAVWGYKAIMGMANTSASSALPVAPHVAMDGGVAHASIVTAADYVAQITPRVVGMPWTAPIFDDRKPKAEPDIYCVAIEHQACRCYSEQVTQIKADQLTCRQIAKNGVYNPFREPFRSKVHDSGPSSADTQDRRVGTSERGSAVVGDPAFPEASSGRDLKVSVGLNGESGAAWPRPDFSYKVPFPSNGKR